MNAGWDGIRTMTTPQDDGGGLYVRLKQDGDRVVGAFCGQPVARSTLWVNGRYETFDENNPEHRGKRPGLRVVSNFYVPEVGAMKLIEGGRAWAKSVVQMIDRFGADAYLYEISRQGAAGSTQTTYTVLPSQKIDEALRAQISATPLHAIGDEAQPTTSSLSGNSPTSDSSLINPTQSGALIDTTQAGALINQLKQLPRSDVDVVLTKFGVQRVRELPAKDLPNVQAMIASLLAHQPSAQDVDPFA